MARKTRVVAAAVGTAGLLALVVAVTRDTGTRRRLGGPGALPTHALLPEHQRKWVHPAGQPVAHHHVSIDTHDRTTGYKPAAVWQIKKFFGALPLDGVSTGRPRRSSRGSTASARARSARRRTRVPVRPPRSSGSRTPCARGSPAASRRPSPRPRKARVSRTSAWATSWSPSSRSPE